MIAPAIPQLCARTREVTGHPLLPASLLEALPAQAGLAWVRRGEGFVGAGQVARLRAQGPQRFAALERQWRAVVALAQVDDQVALPGSGLIAAGSFSFTDASSSESFLLVPRFVLGCREGRWWFTHIWVADDAAAAAPSKADVGAPAGANAGALAGADAQLEEELAAFLTLGREPVSSPGVVSTSSGAHRRSEWAGVVQAAIAAMEAGRAQKVVLARDLYVHTSAPLDPRLPLRSLGANYDGCWTFQVGPWLGATPELLVRLDQGLVAARVLAGTIQRTGDDAADLLRAGNLARSSKDLAEHEFAVDSVAQALRGFCATLNVPEQPFVLHLPNVMHLATDVTGVLRAGGATSLSLAGALHPSAAVGGTPRAAALEVIAELEGMDRANYAAPVGWLDAGGDGEWCIALRCGVIESQPLPHSPAQHAGRKKGAGGGNVVPQDVPASHASQVGSTIRVFAGGGILPQSVPQAEVAETSAKLAPMLGALGVQTA